MQKVMVEFYDEPPLTYEVEGTAHVGDKVAAPYGNIRPGIRSGVITHIGAQGRLKNGAWEPPYEGPCKTALVVECPHGVASFEDDRE